MQITIVDAKGAEICTRNANFNSSKSTALAAMFLLDEKIPANSTIAETSLGAMKIHAKEKLGGKWNINGSPVKARISNKEVSLIKA